MISYRYCTGASKGLGGLRHREISQWRIPSFLLLYILYIGVISALLDLIIKHSAYRFHHRSTRDIMNLIFKHRSLSLASLSEISFAPRTIPFAFIYIYIYFSLCSLSLLIILASILLEYRVKILLSRTHVFTVKVSMRMRFIFYSGTDE